ncbi:toxin-antitoxin system HicB family antitoxin [Clostridiales bacterium AM23-16LB]|nr:toxin-antitoxin system HicB family antitoxin [Clostridiales bacterium AM23-16LB]RHR46357.1 toxin-antitoxin system HicB family antitoxin [Clostridiaceae bacterium AF18-31LB]RHW02968.1 toxin-antitoxin system HicB family antitoxin [Clostridiaceae bacterium OF09-1]
MQEIKERRFKMTTNNRASGNIKLRLPVSLHQALVEQADYENVSLNQLCLMYLSAAVTRGHVGVGTEKFNQRLEHIRYNSKDEQELFSELRRLNSDVEALKPALIQELKNAIENKKRITKEYVDCLGDIYPVYSGRTVLKEELPILKVPSAKIVLEPNKKGYPDLRKIEELVTDICKDVYIAYGDFDYFIPLEERPNSDLNHQSVVINVCCEFHDLEKNVEDIKEALCEYAEQNALKIRIRPCYLIVPTKNLLNMEDNENSDTYYE